jgi:hypothetical protein
LSLDAGLATSEQLTEVPSTARPTSYPTPIIVAGITRFCSEACGACRPGRCITAEHLVRRSHAMDRRTVLTQPVNTSMMLGDCSPTSRGGIVAQKVQIAFIDDVDGGVAAGTVTFGLDSKEYEIDLSEANAQALREVLAPWVGHARRLSGRGSSRGRSSAARASSSRADLVAVRAWARENGYQISGRGRVAGEVLAAYEAAH